MKNTTISLMESLAQTLDVAAFLAGVREFDGVTQRQCLLKALKELRAPGVIRLHGQDRTRAALQALRNELGNAALPTAP